MAILTMARHRFYKNDGSLNAGGKVWTYVAGTTTPAATYTSSDASVPNTNPIILNSKGECDLWITGQIKINVLESDDTQVTGWPVDNIGSGVANNDATMRWAGTAAGTANALTITPSPSIAAYVVGQSFIFKAGASPNSAATTIAISGLTPIAMQFNGAACAGGEIQANKLYSITLDSLTTCQLTPLASIRSDETFVAQDFRLSLTTGVPVTTSDVTGATTIYAVPKTGNRIGLYDGARWRNYTSAEFSLALGTLTSGKPYDVFCYQNAGVPTLEFLAWTNDSTRATALAYDSGILIKSGDATRRYLGTFYTTSTTQTEDSVANRYLWNYYHRAVRQMSRIETTASWTYTTATIRQANASASNQLNFFIGLVEDTVDATASSWATNTSANIYVQSGVGLNSTSSFSSIGNSASAITIGQPATPSGRFVGIPALGKNYLSWNEYSTALGTTTWAGNTNNSGINGSVLA